MRLLIISMIISAAHVVSMSQDTPVSSASISAKTEDTGIRTIVFKSVFRNKTDLLETSDSQSEIVSSDKTLGIRSGASEFFDAKSALSPHEIARTFEKQEYVPTKTDSPQQNGKKGFDWKGAMYQSALLLAVQHGFRLTEDKTTSEFDGPFFRDWRESVANLKGWDDNGKFFTNYIAHPMQGSIYARIFINNSPYAKSHEFGKSKEYWISRMKALAWSAAWSTQFEIGPVSEASLGNVGQRLHPNGVSPLSYIDLVLTPTMGTGLTIVEDAVDLYVLKNWIEKKVHNKVLMKFLRSALTPMTGFANLMRFRAPWWRDDKVSR